MDDESLKQEVARLQAEVEAYRQRELDSLRGQLAAARERNVILEREVQAKISAGHEIYRLGQERITKLEAQLAATKPETSRARFK